MSGLAILIPIAVLMGLVALATFMWAVNSGQYEDLDGASVRILGDDAKPLAGSPGALPQPPQISDNHAPPA